MRLRILASILVLASGATIWLTSNFWENSGKLSSRSGTTPTFFATLRAQKSSELYLKDSRAFIFSRTDSGQNLKLHDSVLVGPKSEATLLLSDEFGGGKIRLAANTIITLSRAGRQNEIPRIDIKQGAIKILEAPRKQRAELQAQSKVTQAAIQTEAVPEILITGGQQAVVFDESLKNAELGVEEKTKTLEIKIVAAQNAKEVSEDILAEQEVQAEVPTKTFDVVAATDAPLQTNPVNMTPIIKTVSLEAFEEVSLKGQSLSEVVAKIQSVEPAKASSIVTREPAEEMSENTAQQLPVKTNDHVAIVEQKPAPTPIAQKAPAKKQIVKTAETEPVPQEEQSQPLPSSNVARAEQTTSTPLHTYLFEISGSLAARSYQGSSAKAQATDLDVGIKGEAPIFEKLKIAALAKISALNLKKPSSGAPRPMSLSAEVKYLISRTKRFWLVGGYTYQTSFGGGTTASYENLYAPHFGFDANFSFDANADKNLLIAPRFSLISGSSYSLALPVTYYWSPRWGVALSYELIKIKASGKAEKEFQTLSSGIRWKF